MHMKSRTAGWRFHTSIRPGQRSTSTMRGDAQPGSGQATRLSDCPASTRQEPPFSRGTRFLDNRFLEVGTKSAVLGGVRGSAITRFRGSDSPTRRHPPLRRNYLKVDPPKTAFFVPKLPAPPSAEHCIPKSRRRWLARTARRHSATDSFQMNDFTFSAATLLARSQVKEPRCLKTQQQTQRLQKARL